VLRYYSSETYVHISLDVMTNKEGVRVFQVDRVQLYPGQMPDIINQETLTNERDAMTRYCTFVMFETCESLVIPDLQDGETLTLNIT
jgi:hypothetical protein